MSNSIPVRPSSGCAEIDSYKGPIIGADEVGWGCCAGPLIVAAASAPPGWYDPAVKDSKALSAAKREAIYREYGGTGWPVVIVRIEAPEVDRLGPGKARVFAFQRAIEELVPQARSRWGVPLVVVDGDLSGLETDDCWTVSLAKADARVPEVSLASCLAKVHRDHLMVALHQQWPVYNWERNKGYPTKDHLETLNLLGPTPQHRRSYRPVAQAEKAKTWAMIEHLGSA